LIIDSSSSKVVKETAPLEAFVSLPEKPGSALRLASVQKNKDFAGSYHPLREMQDKIGCQPSDDEARLDRFAR
jgi:hypothetical protein